VHSRGFETGFEQLIAQEPRKENICLITMILERRTPVGGLGFEKTRLTDWVCPLLFNDIE